MVFLIPLVGPDHVGDWHAVVARLHQTLASFQAQTNPNWRAAICCQSKPELPRDDRITWLHFDDAAPGNDKWRKLGQLCAALPKLTANACYAMSFDADDLLHRDAVDDMLRLQSHGGYLAQSGFVQDCATGLIALADAPSVATPLRKPFWKLCGSCAALYYDPDIAESTTFLSAMTQHEHRMFPYLAQLAGQKLDALPYPAVLYQLNHGENFGARRGRISFKTRFTSRFQISDPDTLAGIPRDFALPMGQQNLLRSSSV